MNKGILDRYLLREVTGAMSAVILVLMAIMLSTRFARFLAQAAAGKLPREVLFKVVALSSLQYLVILIPFSLLLGVMLALGRLYKDNEIAAMTGCGVGMQALYRPFMYVGAVLALVTAVLSFDVGPWAGRTADYLAKDAARYVQFNPFEPGRFKDVAGGRAVFYTAGMDASGEHLEGVFAQIHESAGDSIVLARSGHQQFDESGERKIVLDDGYRYLGNAGNAGYEVIHYGELETRVVPPEFIYSNSKRAIAETATLLASDGLEDRAELQWRLAAPLSVFILGLLAVPLAHVGPRQGRYGKLVLGIGVYLLYSQLLGLGQTWIAQGKVSSLVGLWWVHLLMLAFAGVVIARRQGWFAAWAARRQAAT
ncbi:MAG TPA: LPS export ABC transporter permease LptF [Nevskiaceae bacterium]|nr:LPS export ABC transporter permease LptF [Nevskiaceae bacterium]